MKRIPKINPSTGIVLVLLITTSITIYGLKTLQDQNAADDWVTRSRAVIATTDQVLLGVVNMENGFRGYMLSGREDFLVPFHSGKALYETSIQLLFDLTDDNSSQEVRWKEIQTLENLWEMDWAAKGIQLRQDINAGKISSSGVISYVVPEGSQEIMVAIRQKLADGKQEEEGLLAQRLQTVHTANTWAYGVMIVGIFISVILGLTTGIFLTRTNAKNVEQIELQQLLLEARDKERMQIARDLHDGPIQELIAATYTIQEIADEHGEPWFGEELSTIRAPILEIIGDLRAYAMELRSPVLKQFGLEKAIQSHLEGVSCRHPELSIQFEASQEDDLLPEDCRNALFRIFQEALSNILRHSRASEVVITYGQQNGEAVLEIKDNGVGFEPPVNLLELARQGHLGLVGMRERAEAIGAQLEIKSHPGQGTSMRIVVHI
jgi:signal transduction histidine kinase